jgi:hypothetical protein
VALFRLRPIGVLVCGSTLTIVTGAVRAPSSFASEVVARAKDVLKGGGGGGRGGEGVRLEPFFDGAGLTTSSDDDERSSQSAPFSSRVSSEDSYGGAGENDDGLRRRFAPQREM